MIVAEAHDDFLRREKSVRFMQDVLADDEGLYEIDQRMQKLNAAEQFLRSYRPYMRTPEFSYLTHLAEAKKRAEDLGRITTTKSTHIWPAVGDLRNVIAAQRCELEAPRVEAL